MMTSQPILQGEVIIMTTRSYEEIKEMIMEQLEDLDFDTLAYLWNEKEISENSDREIYGMSESALEMLNQSLFSTILRIQYGDFDIDDDYFTINGYGNYESFNDFKDANCPIDLEELAEWLTTDDNYANYDNELGDLSEILEEED